MKELEDNRAIAEENYNKRKDKKKNDPPFDENKYYRFKKKYQHKRACEDDRRYRQRSFQLGERQGKA